MADDDIVHAVERSLAEFEIDEDPTRALVLDDDRLMVIHVVPLRDQYHHLLPKGDSDARLRAAALQGSLERLPA